MYNTYGRYYDREDFVISNCDSEDEAFIPKNAFDYPTLKITVLDCDIRTRYGVRSHNVQDFLDTVSYGDYNHPEFEEKCLQIFNGELENWKLVAVSIERSANCLFHFMTNNPPVKDKDGYNLDEGVFVCMPCGALSLRFTKSEAKRS